jgi:hypothetical protein
VVESGPAPGGTPSNDDVLEDDNPSKEAVPEESAPIGSSTGHSTQQRAAPKEKAPSTTLRNGTVVGEKRLRDDTEGPRSSSIPRRQGLRQRKPVQHATESGPISKKPH